jgi:glycosyltransferase involved in cell wall biosynthesis
VHVLHAIHDFLPRHRAGSELYALELARAQSARHHVTILCADYDLARPHGQVAWRVHAGIPVVEVVNNWRCATFEETYRPPLVGQRIAQVLTTLRPDVVHVHNLLNLSFELPSMAQALGIPVVATLHDYTLVCASGGQRVHRRDRHVCDEIDPRRCARCFVESPFRTQTALGRVASGGLTARALARLASSARRLAPRLSSRAAGLLQWAGGPPLRPEDIEARLRAARDVFRHVDLFVAPSADLASAFERFGLPGDRLRVSAYGLPPRHAAPRQPARKPVRFGFIGTLAWHKGAHVLIEAARSLPLDAFDLKLFGAWTTFPQYVAELKSSAGSLPISFEGSFAPERVPEIYSSMDVLIVPSLWPENSPFVIHEAFQLGVPVVAARTGGIPQLVEDGVNGWLVEPGCGADLVRVLRRLIDEPSLITQASPRTPRPVSIDEDAAWWESAYDAVIRRAGRRSA